MAGIKYVTYEKQRDRYVFQMRVPRAVRCAFEGCTTIRQALGRLCAAEAEQRGAALAKHWQARFDTARRTPAAHRRAPERVVELALDEELARRAVASSRALQLAPLQQALLALRGAADDEPWNEALRVAEEGLAAARRRLARGQSGPAEAALRGLESTYRIRLRRTSVETGHFAEQWNVDTVRVATTWLAVLKGEASLEALAVPCEDLLPLTRFFGTRADHLAGRWQERLGRLGRTAPSKTLAKYRSIAAALQAVLDERPVELLREVDLAALTASWRSRGNGAVTIADKLTLLASLLRPVSAAAAALCKNVLPRTRLGRVRRRPFSVEQLTTLRAVFAADERLPREDLHLVDLMTLTGARLGELLPLQAAALTRTADGWVIAFHERAETRLKTTSSARELPIDPRALPDLEAWLGARKAAGARLFPDSAPDRYGHYGNAQSKRLNRVLRAHFADRRLVLQSLRNTVAQTLRRDGVEARVRRRFLGHADLDIHDMHYDPAELLGAADLRTAVPVLAALAARVRAGHPPGGLP
jgi:integrase